MNNYYYEMDCILGELKMYHIPVFDKIISKAIDSERYVNFNEEQVNILYRALTLYGLGLIKAKPFNDMLVYVDKKGKKRNLLEGNERVKIRYAVQIDTKVILSLRGFIYFLVQNNVFNIPEGNESKITALAYYFGLDVEDLWILDFIRNQKLLNKEYIELIHSFPPALTPNQAKKICTEAFKSLRGYLRTYAYNKLRFICSSNNLQIEDMFSPLEYTVCHSCYNTIAQKRGTYLVNSLKQSIHNEVINTIMFYTSKARKRLEGNKIEGTEDYNYYLGKGSSEFYNTEFENIVRSINISIDGEGSEDLLEFIGGVDDSEKIESSASMYFLNKKILEAYGKNSLQYRFAKIVHNKNFDFLNWYNINKGTNEASISDIQQIEGDEFPQLLCKYFNITKPDYEKLVQDMKPFYKDLF